jgi:hypothetical protein
MKKALALSVLLGIARRRARPAAAPGSDQKADMPELKQGDVDMAKLNAALTTKRRELFAQAWRDSRRSSSRRSGGSTPSSRRRRTRT